MRRILLLDDEINVLNALNRTLRRIFQGKEVQLELFTDPEQALLRCADVLFDVVMSDYRMPGLTGADFLEMVKGIQPDAVRLVLSGSNDFAELMDVTNRGHIFRFVSKPWSEDELKRTFQLAFERHDEAGKPRAAPALSAHEQEARRLEAEEPGITQVRRAADGSVYLDWPEGE
jgi:two-component system probable response regulator PhcQ